MTRAGLSLTLARFNTGKALVDELPEVSCLLRRDVTQLPSPGPELERSYLRPEFDEIYVDFSGCHDKADPIHKAIAALSVDDRLILRRQGNLFYLFDDKENVVGRLAKKYPPPRGKRCITARVDAIIVRRPEDAGPGFQENIKCDRWEAVLPELVYESDGSCRQRRDVWK